MIRITQEADYAVRICCILARCQKTVGASEIAREACVTQKFALKILRKLAGCGIVSSFKGAFGGYRLDRNADDLNVLEIIEAIEGPLKISKCLDCDHECTKNPVKDDCKMHHAFMRINDILTENFKMITVGKLNDRSISVDDLTGYMKNTE